MGYEIISDKHWRVSRSGFSIVTGWSDERVVISSYPGTAIPLNGDEFQKWLTAAEKICEAHNAALATTDPKQEPQQAEPVALVLSFELARAVIDGRATVTQAEEVIDALNAAPPQSPGMVMVPEEPTSAMEDAALESARFEYGHGVTRASVRNIYRAMLKQEKPT